MKKQHSRGGFLSLKMIVIVALIFSTIVVMASAFNKELGETNAPFAGVKKDRAESVEAFMEVYKVLMSPRCMNCHPSGDVPLQGDNNLIHTMLPKRAKDGKGVYAMKCTNCHQPENTPGLHAPPGNPNWHLPPADMKMVFQGKTPHQLARQLVDPKQNGNKTMKQLLEHAKDDLVKWGWEPGEGRTLPPLSYAEFVKAWNTWIEKGAYAPDPKTK